MNLQGDVIGIYDGNGNVVVEYTYDSWGKLISVTGSLASTIGIKNPLRYRGYYYDTETSLYYLQSRYYDPETCRFINADSLLIAGDDYIQGTNMFSYCYNNPVMYSDPTGYANSKTVQETIGIGVAIVIATGACAQALIDMFGYEQALEIARNIASSGDDVYALIDFIGYAADALGLVGTAVGVVADNSSKLVNVGGAIWQNQTTMPKAASAAKGLGTATTIVGAALTGIEIYNLWKNRDDLNTNQKIAGTAIEAGGFAAGMGVGALSAKAGMAAAAACLANPAIAGVVAAVGVGVAGAAGIYYLTNYLNKKVGI